MSTTTRVRAVRALGTGVAAILFLLLTVPAAAHVRTSDGWSQIRSDGGRVEYRLGLEYEILARAIGMGTAAIEAPDDSARAAALVEQHDLVETYLAGRVLIFADEVRCEPALEGSGIERLPASDTTVEDVPYAVLELGYDCHGPAGRYTVDYSVFSGLGSDAVVDDHTSTVDYELGDERGRVVLDSAAPRFSTGEQSFGSSVLRSAGLGLQRMVGGLDHALFVAALVVGASGLPALARSLAVFAVAHSAAMLAAVVGWVSLPVGVVGPLVALSVVYVAASNVVGPQSRYRLAVVAAFGLAHGLALAGDLRFGPDRGWAQVASYAGFNLGVELGQVALAAVLFPLVIVARRYPWFSLAQLVAAAVLALTGLAWFVHRLL